MRRGNIAVNPNAAKDFPSARESPPALAFSQVEKVERFDRRAGFVLSGSQRGGHFSDDHPDVVMVVPIFGPPARRHPMRNLEITKNLKMCEILEKW
ncbi:MAG: hypothetical protein WD342_00520 [Verrucomicrobiales bacterium]